MPIDRNIHRRAWFDLFARSVDDNDTAREVGFLRRVLPLDGFPRILDLACGAGRHALALANAGRAVVGIDSDEREIDLARAGAPAGALFQTLDMRALAELDGPFDACISMWQSFGFFDDATNERILADLARLLRPRGRLVLDLFNREHFERARGVRRYQRAGAWVNENRWIERDRLCMHLSFDGGALLDVFDWRIDTPDGLAQACAKAGFVEAGRCARFDESRAPGTGEPRIQMVFERV